ncbi:hypothetical protein NDN08_005583 [Rhodosorus marinus]|uniref:Enoyl reductase (ER) domain-containing protein n=1 Tax=Rhodosorus marinus TaxID=101924 RepID=A0AAV8V2D9_9RHOD|nr:hypothetical protein NDN08_005583 [Rhodosorus marinus]
MGSEKMRAFMCYQYGSPADLVLEEVERPVPKANEVLAKAESISLNAGDWHVIRGDPFVVKLMFGLNKPRDPILGFDFAGRVVAVGSDVKNFKAGDEVFGDMNLGAFAEYACKPETQFVRKPSSMSFEQAATLPTAGGTALIAARDLTHVTAGQKVLVIGACGGVGSFCIQIVKSMGSHVTAVCSTSNVDMAKELGADEVFDYKKEDICKSGRVFDVILDNGLFRSMLDYRQIMNPAGSTYLLIGGSTNRFFPAMAMSPFVSMFNKKKMKICTAEPGPALLKDLVELFEAGKVKPAIKRRYKFEQLPEGLIYLEEGHTVGKVVVNV